MKKRILSFLAALGCMCSASYGSVTISFEAGQIRDASGAPLPVGTVGVIMVDSQSNGFAGATGNAMSSASYSNLVGLQLTAGQAVGDDVILAVFQITNVDVDGSAPLDRVFSGNLLSSYNYSGNIGETDALGLFWFPGITTTGATLGGAQGEAGFYTRPTNDLASNSQIGFALPADGFSGNLFAYDSALTGSGGSASTTSFSAVALAPVPEPSRVLLAGLGAFGFFMRRRRKA